MAGRTKLVLLDAGAVFAALINRPDGPETHDGACRPHVLGSPYRTRLDPAWHSGSWDATPCTTKAAGWPVHYRTGSPRDAGSSLPASNLTTPHDGSQSNVERQLLRGIADAVFPPSAAGRGAGACQAG